MSVGLEARKLWEFVDALRETLGLDPLYNDNTTISEKERFGRTVPTPMMACGRIQLFPDHQDFRDQVDSGELE